MANSEKNVVRARGSVIANRLMCIVSARFNARSLVPLDVDAAQMLFPHAFHFGMYRATESPWPAPKGATGRAARWRFGPFRGRPGRARPPAEQGLRFTSTKIPSRRKAMKRLLVRLSALSGVVAVGLCTLFAAQRLLPQADAQETDPLEVRAKPKVKSSPSSAPTNSRTSAKAKKKKSTAPAGRRAEPLAESPTENRYADRYGDRRAAGAEPPDQPRAFDDDGVPPEPLDSASRSRAAGANAPGSTRGEPFPAKSKPKKQAAPNRVPTPALDRRFVKDAEMHVGDAGGRDERASELSMQEEHEGQVADRRAGNAMNPFDEPADATRPTTRGRASLAAGTSKGPRRRP